MAALGRIVRTEVLEVRPIGSQYTTSSNGLPNRAAAGLPWIVTFSLMVGAMHSTKHPVGQQLVARHKGFAAATGRREGSAPT
jgi:hypothetical protein